VHIVDIVDCGFMFYFRQLQLKCTSCKEPHRQEMLVIFFKLALKQAVHIIPIFYFQS
jgi:hypothetical protein